MMRNYNYRVELIRNGATVMELQAVEPPKIICDTDSEIKTAASGVFKYAPEADFLNDEIKMFLSTDGIEKPVGVFSVSTYADNYVGLEHRMSIEMYDRCYKLQQTRTENILHIAAGTNYIEAVKQLLAVAGIALYIATPIASALATDREDWDIGTDFLTIVNALLKEINYADIWFDYNGYAIITPEKEATAENIQHYLSAGEINVLSDDCTAETDIFAKPNVFVVVCSNADLDAPLTSVAVNDNPISKLSVLKRGKRIAEVVDVDNIADQAALDTYAQKLVNDSMMSAETVTINTAPLSGFGVGDIVALEHEGATGIYKSVGWELVLGAREQMSHTLRRSVLI